MKYNEDAVENIYQENLKTARQKLASLIVADGREPNIKGLSGWVYEQTIRHCLTSEFEIPGITRLSDKDVKEQVPLQGRSRIDLLVGNIAIEIKALGSFGRDSKKYSEYQLKIEKKGWKYCYLTRSESYKPYRSAMEAVFGRKFTFFLDTKGDWERFIEMIKSHREV